MPNTEQSPAPAEPAESRWPVRLGVSLVIVLQLALYWSIPGQGFTQDDFCWLAEARRSMESPANIFTLSISGFFRPVVHLVFLANYAVAGLDAWWYGVANVAFEVCGTALFAWLAWRCTKSAWAVVAGSLIFATHPAHGEVVGWISARTTSLAAIFILLTLICWLNWRQRGRNTWLGGALVSYCLALLTKEEAVTLWPILLAADWLVSPLLQPSPTKKEGCSERRPSAKARACALLGALGVLIAYAVTQHYFQSQNLLVRQGAYGLDMSAVSHWLERVPALFVSKGAVSGPWLIAVFLVEAALAWLVLRRAPRELWRVAAFGLVWALLALMPTSLFTTHYAARYSYIATVGSSLAWVALFAATRHCPMPQRRPLGIAVTILAAATFITQTHHLQRKLDYWREQGACGKQFLEAARQVAPAVAEARARGRPVCVVGVPAETTHVRGLFSVVSEADSVGDDLEVAASVEAYRSAPSSFALMWDAEKAAFVVQESP